MLEPSDIAPETARPLRRAEYERLVESGAFEDERVELLHGVNVRMSPRGTAHTDVVRRLNMLLAPLLAGRAAVSVQAPLAVTDDSEPEPDLAVVAPDLGWDEHPTTASLVVEVADTSLNKDRRVKSALYAAAGVEEYWIVDLPGRAVEVRTDPTEGEYRTVARYGHGGSVTLRAFPDITLVVDDFLP
ncbi:MAG: Uma2 family endonuclease [Myxococcota bacterium]